MSAPSVDDTFFLIHVDTYEVSNTAAKGSFDIHHPKHLYLDYQKTLKAPRHDNRYRYHAIKFAIYLHEYLQFRQRYRPVQKGRN